MTNHIDVETVQPQHRLSMILFRKVARISLWVSLLSVISLTFIISSIEAPAGDYLSMLRELTSSQENLLYIILAAGTWLIAATAATTYFIILYSSFRIAGPLFRFARNLEFGCQHELPQPMIRIRAADYFQEECQLIEQAVDTLLSHYQTIAQEIDQLIVLSKDNELNQQQIVAKIIQLKAIEDKLIK